MSVGLSADNPMNRAMLSLLVFEVIVFGLGIPGMLLLDDVPVAVAVGATSAAIVLAIAAAGTLRRPIGYPLGWLTQVAGLALGFLTPMMFAASGIFALVWVGCFVLGRRIENTPTR
ncbi:DUF4233 domain-containing protein [Aestuariimicrobium soli]|uniref:DUF4233 domain-containing protein n=1 Tax=Aestuariimicrobium soli TaxID=2035834 RepID=UPI003EBF2ADF